MGTLTPSFFWDAQSKMKLAMRFFAVNVPGISIPFNSKLSLTQREPVYSLKLRQRNAGSGTDVFPIRTSKTSAS
jgi:hypothetical protein